MKHRVCVALAFVLGGLLTYGIMSWHGEKWGILVTEIGVGTHLEGFADTKKMCLDLAEVLGKVERESEERQMKQMKEMGVAWHLKVVDHSCLPLSQLRGLPLVTN